MLDRSFEDEKGTVLYKFLMDDFGFKKIETKVGDVILANNNFLIRYFDDWKDDTWYIAIANPADKINVHGIVQTHWYSLSFIKDLIYCPDRINDNIDWVSDKVKRIKDMNHFIKKDFDKINELFIKENYTETKRKLEEGLRKTYNKYHPHHPL